eukprot:Skav216082  [mRNA]  locus=scaffold2042:43406:45754:+ [translate_table: standard]
MLKELWQIAKIRQKEIQDVAHKLKESNKSLASVLSLDEPAVDPGDMSLCRNLKENPNVQVSAKLHDSHRIFEGCYHRASCTFQRKSLTDIDLAHNGIGQKGAQARKSQQKHHPHKDGSVKKEYSSDAKAVKVLEPRMALHRITARDRQTQAAVSAKALKANTWVTDIGLNGNKIGDDGAEPRRDRCRCI